MYNVEQCRFIGQMVKHTLAQFVLKAFPTAKADVIIQHGPKNECEYVSPLAMKAFNVNKDKATGIAFGCKTIEEFAQKIVDNFH